MDHKNEYSCKVVWSSRTLTVAEKIAYKNLDNTISLAELVEQGPVNIDVSHWLTLEIHNERNKNGDHDYTKHIIVDTAGTIYSSGSDSLERSLYEISSDLEEAAEAGESIPMRIKVYQKESTNYKGKYFLTASLDLEALKA